MQNPTARVKLFTRVRGPRSRGYTHTVSFDHYIWNPTKSCGWVEPHTRGRRPRAAQTSLKPKVSIDSSEKCLAWLRQELAKVLACKPSEVAFENTRFYDPDHDV